MLPPKLTLLPWMPPEDTLSSCVTCAVAAVHRARNADGTRTDELERMAGLRPDSTPACAGRALPLRRLVRAHARAVDHGVAEQAHRAAEPVAEVRCAGEQDHL